MDENNSDKPETVLPTNHTTEPEDSKASVAQTIPEAATSVTTVDTTVSSPETMTPDTTVPTSETPVASDEYTETKSNKLIYIFVFVLVVILLSLVGLFFYKQYLNTTGSSNTPTAQPTIVASPSVLPSTEEETELNQIEIPDLDQELQDVEEDIEQL